MTRGLSFEDFVREFTSSLVATAMLLKGGDHHAAEDLVQDSLLKAGGRWLLVQRAQYPIAYVRRIMMNIFLDELRRKKVFEVVVAPGELELAEPSGTNESWLSRQDFQEGLMVLPRQQRAAVILRYYDDLTYAQIAAAMQIKESAARSHVSRGLKTLSRSLTADEATQGVGSDGN